MDYKKLALQKHQEWQGKLEITARCPLETREDLSLAYTPGVAQPCLEIQRNPELSYEYTRRGNLVAVISDGSAVLGLGNIGALGAMPVMEGKCVLFKRFGGVDAIPIVLDTQNVDEIIQTVKNLAPSFGGINLEDISAPRCFEIEDKLKSILDIPVFHDDQHGTAVVVLSALINALKVVNKSMDKIKVCLVGAGSAGCAITSLLLSAGVKDIIMCDKDGILYDGMPQLDGKRAELAKQTNRENKKGKLQDAIVGADVFIGVSAPNLLTQEMVSAMAKNPIVFAMANPEPEILPHLAKQAGAMVVGTGRSDYPNQVNNVLAFPGIFKGALSVRARAITENMKLSAAYALASLVSESELSPEYIIPSPLNPSAVQAVAQAVAKQAIADKVNRI